MIIRSSVTRLGESSLVLVICNFIANHAKTLPKLIAESIKMRSEALQGTSRAPVKRFRRRELRQEDISECYAKTNFLRIRACYMCILLLSKQATNVAMLAGRNVLL